MHNSPPSCHGEVGNQWKELNQNKKHYQHKTCECTHSQASSHHQVQNQWKKIEQTKYLVNINQVGMNTLTFCSHHS